MQTRRYAAGDLARAMEDVRRELGEDAIIVDVRKAKRGGVLGFFGKPEVEVWAADGSPRRPKRKLDVELGGDRREVARIVRDAGRQDPAPPPAGDGAAPSTGRAVPEGPAPSSARAGGGDGPGDPDRRPDDGTRPMSEGSMPCSVRSRPRPDLASQLSEMKQMLRRVLDAVDLQSGIGSLPPEATALYRSLQEKGFSDSLSGELVRSAAKKAALSCDTYAPSLLERYVVDELTALVTPCAPLNPDVEAGVVCLVGPTGHGKSSAAAALAALFSARRGRRVVLVNADHERAGGAATLKSVSDIIGVPFVDVDGPGRLSEAVKGRRDSALVIVDTTGMNPRDAVKMAELRSLLRSARPDETHLVLAMNTAPADALAAARAFGEAGFDRYLFTKADEATGASLPFNLMYEHARPVSYVSSGRASIESLREATPRLLVDLSMKRSEERTRDRAKDGKRGEARRKGA